MLNWFLWSCIVLLRRVGVQKLSVREVREASQNSQKEKRWGIKRRVDYHADSIRFMVPERSWTE